jgi:EAL domain-containing protein (putative c-di-GMP-specific phosphodiesterase class I)
MDDPREGRTILNAIVSLAASLDLELVAEGIEQPAQARELQQVGCQYGQGYHLGRPMSAEAMDEHLAGALGHRRPHAANPPIPALPSAP